MLRVTKIAKKIAVSVTAIPLLIIGIILVPLPGPGLLLCFIALSLLSFEFDSAQQHTLRIKRKFREIYAHAEARADKIENFGDKKNRA